MEALWGWSVFSTDCSSNHTDLMYVCCLLHPLVLCGPPTTCTAVTVTTTITAAGYTIPKLLWTSHTTKWPISPMTMPGYSMVPLPLCFWRRRSINHKMKGRLPSAILACTGTVLTSRTRDTRIMRVRLSDLIDVRQRPCSLAIGADPGGDEHYYYEGLDRAQWLPLRLSSATV